MSKQINNKTARIQELVSEINHHNNLYYNENTPEISDTEYDKLLDELLKLEAETGVILSNSPTQKVGAPVVSSLAVVRHDIPLLSLEKTKDFSEVLKFIGEKTALIMLKLDGLTVKLDYDGGELVQASTRGDGNEGENITHNARVFTNVPLRIPFLGKLTVVGEAHILADDFKILQATTTGKDGKTYKNARNLAAGSVRQLDAGECSKRRIRFNAFNVLAASGAEKVSTLSADVNSKISLLRFIEAMGFSVAHFTSIDAESKNDFESIVSDLREYAGDSGIPIDGLVRVTPIPAYKIEFFPPTFGTFR